MEAAELAVESDYTKSRAMDRPQAQDLMGGALFERFVEPQAWRDQAELAENGMAGEDIERESFKELCGVCRAV